MYLQFISLRDEARQAVHRFGVFLVQLYGLPVGLFDLLWVE
jgi:hypothetical protein